MATDGSEGKKGLWDRRVAICVGMLRDIKRSSSGEDLGGWHHHLSLLGTGLSREGERKEQDIQ